MRRYILPLVFGIVGTAILISLGNWQVRRLAWKEAVLAEIDARIVGAPAALPTLAAPEVDRYRPVTVTGQVTSDEIHVLASSKRTGAIYRIIATMETEAGRRVMVDRGWVKPEAKDLDHGAGAMTVIGNLHWPDEIDGYTPDPDLSANIWFARDVSAMAELLQTEPILIVVRETSEIDPVVTPMPVTSEGIPNDHLNYAVTWYGLALVWIVMTLYYLRRMRIQKRV